MKPRELEIGVGDGDLKMHLTQRADWWLPVGKGVGGWAYRAEGSTVWR